jgi:hypothetical protein
MGKKNLEKKVNRNTFSKYKSQAAMEFLMYRAKGSMLKNSKTQAAMEFLMTYGWALLVVLIVGIALFYYFGNPYMLFPNKIDFGQGIHVPDFTYGYLEYKDYKVGSFEILIRNNLGDPIKDVTLTIDQCNNSLGAESEKFAILPGKIHKLVFNCEDIFTDINSVNKFNGTLEFNIKVAQENMNYKRKAEIIVTSKELVKFPDNNKGRMIWALRNGASGKDDENRFFPCDDVEGCINNDDSGVLKEIFGGYIDSKTGKVWSDESDDSNLVWSIQQSNSWDNEHFYWDYAAKTYVRKEVGNLAKRDDLIGSAFTYCTELNINSKSDWKLTSVNDFEGMQDCNQCLPPFGKYGTDKSLANLKYYWTEDSLEDDGQSKCLIFVDKYNTLFASCARAQGYAVRCIRDNP